MARFIVRFLKDVLGENGHEAEICQSYLEMQAANRTEAVELAKKIFFEKKILTDWSLHADRVRGGRGSIPIVTCLLRPRVGRRRS
jgi:hypothetical protein